jgi:SAM-dependent methyltransferase
MMDRQRRLAFGDVAELYDRVRPSYPSALVDDILEFADAGAGARALEIGAGTGKATALFAERGLRIVGLEPSAEMARIARRNTAAYGGVAIEQAEFERWSPQGAFRLVFSAQAWHWIAPNVRYSRAREALDPGGALAVFWNRARWEGMAVRAELADVYRTTAPQLGSGVGPGPMHPAVPAAPNWWHDWENELRSAAGFVDPQIRSYPWSERYETGAYVELLQTHSDHILLEPAQREALLDGVGRVIDRHGGRLEFEYVTVVAMARRAGEIASDG